jgi:hypothetical protein
MRILALLFVVLVPTTLAAQTTVSPEVFVRGGLVKLWDDEGNIGTGPSVSGGGGVRLPHGIGLEGYVERHVNDRNFSSGVSFHSHAVSTMARVVKYVGRSQAQPYFGGAVGVTRINTVSEFPGFPRSDRTTTSRTLGGFAGIRFAAGRRAFVRPEFEMSQAGEHLRIAGSVAVGVGW